MAAPTLLRPPSALIDWIATAQGTEFVAYNVYRWPTRLPAMQPIKIARIAAKAGETPATIEAQHTAFIDSEAPWYRDVDGQWADGHNYAVTVETKNGLEAIIQPQATGKIINAACNAWVTCNAAWWLNCPLQVVPSGKSQEDDGAVVRGYTGRDFASVRTPRELPFRNFTANGLFFATVGPDQLRVLRAAAASGKQVSFLRQNGDRVSGKLSVSGYDDAPGGAQYQDVTINVIETGRMPGLADFNLPAGLPLNGSSQYVRTPHTALLNPGAGPFTFIMAAIFPSGDAKHYGGKEDGTSGYVFYTGTGGTGNEVQFAVDGTAANPAETSAAWHDGEPHVAIGTSSGNGAGGARKLYRDGILADTKVGAYTSIVTTNDLVAGVGRNGTIGFTALDPLHAWAYYPRELTAAEAKAASYYLLGYPGYRMPAGAVVFYDLRDSRAEVKGSTTQVADLSGSGLTATKVGSPPHRGYTAPLAAVERF